MQIPLRFIEYMDVGSTNGWNTTDVVTSNELQELVHDAYPVREIPSAYAGEVSRRYAYEDGNGEVGFISSVTKPFCGDCSRARVSAKGALYTCLFASDGVDLRGPLRSGGVNALRPIVERTWRQRSDRYSEQRGAAPAARSRIEMSYIGG
jgi:cyclic pyranopterin phosphate synthase